MLINSRLDHNDLSRKYGFHFSAGEFLILDESLNMKHFLWFLFFLPTISNAQTPAFGREIPVAIQGLTFDAMEPFLSSDGVTLFFNSLNDGVNTSLYYASKLNDSTFVYQGAVGSVNGTGTHLDAVASLDNAANFYWVSTRNYPGVYENLQSGVLDVTGNVSSISPVYGNIYVPYPGWIIMDACINYQGNELIYANAFFNGCPNGLPCYAQLSMASKVNDSTFSRLSNSNTILASVNDTNFLVYAPQVSSDGLELYYTRLLKGTVQTEICVAVRNSTSIPFGNPSVIYTDTFSVPEGPTISTDKTRLYYHRKQSGLYRIYLRYRSGSLFVKEKKKEEINMYPNPSDGNLTFLHLTTNTRIKIFSSAGLMVRDFTSNNENVSLDLRELSQGVYYVILESEQHSIIQKLLILN